MEGSRIGLVFKWHWLTPKSGGMWEALVRNFSTFVSHDWPGALVVAIYVLLTLRENRQGEESYFLSETCILPCVLQQCLWSVKHELGRKVVR